MKRLFEFWAGLVLSVWLATAGGCACWGGACAPDSKDPRVSQLNTAQDGVVSPGMVGEQEDPLRLWNDGEVKRAIVGFVQLVTTAGSRDFIKPSERIAVFDLDGTLWSEQPASAELMFLMQRVRELAPQHPEYKSLQPFKSVLAGDLEAVLATGKAGLLNMLIATHSGMSPEQYEAIVRQWLASGTHPERKRRYSELVYQPMVELMSYLRKNEFKTFIVTSGTVEFVRSFSEELFGVPPEQVIGTSIRTEFASDGEKPMLIRQPELNYVDEGAGRPGGIMASVGRRPVMAFGNSDGDLQMLQWTAGGGGSRFCAIVHHDDARREWSYDRNSKVGRLDRAMDAAAKDGWTVVSMQRDWAVVYPNVESASP